MIPSRWDGVPQYKNVPTMPLILRLAPDGSTIVNEINLSITVGASPEDDCVGAASVANPLLFLLAAIIADDDETTDDDEQPAAAVAAAAQPKR